MSSDPQGISYYLPIVLLATALLIPRTVLSRWQNICIFMPLIVASTVHAWTEMNAVDVISIDVLLWSLYLLVLKDPWKDFTYIGLAQERQNQRPSSESASLVAGQLPVGIPYPSTLAERVPWVGTLLISLRLQGWTIGERSHDSRNLRSSADPPVPSRSRFVRNALVSFARGWLVLDLTGAYQIHDSYFSDLNTSISSPLPFKTLCIFPPQLFRSLIIGAQVWASLSQLIYLPFLVLVGLNAVRLLPDEWSPHTWRPFFGDPRVILHHGVQGFWGRYWHQSMRRFTSGPGEAIADVLRLKHRSILRYTIILIVAFGLSGIVHMGHVPPKPLSSTMRVSHLRLQIAAFWWVQPIGIIAEMVAVRLVLLMVPQRMLDSRTGSIFKMSANASTFILWFAVSIPVLGEAVRQLGYWRMWPVPFSLWRGITGEGWMAWS